MRILTDNKVAQLERAAYKDGKEYCKALCDDTIEAQKKELKRLRRAVEKHNALVEDLKEDHKAETTRLLSRIRILEQERRDYSELVEEQLRVEDMQAVLQTRQDLLEQRENRVSERESLVEDTENGRYKEGYADGVADGIRKINEITQKDRDNAMKVAMVAASSHTPVANMREINSELRQLTASGQDSEDE